MCIRDSYKGAELHYNMYKTRAMVNLMIYFTEARVYYIIYSMDAGMHCML